MCPFSGVGGDIRLLSNAFADSLSESIRSILVDFLKGRAAIDVSPSFAACRPSLLRQRCATVAPTNCHQAYALVR